MSWSRTSSLASRKVGVIVVATVSFGTIKACAMGASNIGMMDAAYFVGRNEILNWVNSTLQLSLSKVEEVLQFHNHVLNTHLHVHIWLHFSS